MGKSNAKKTRACGYIKPHPSHVWTDTHKVAEIKNGRKTGEILEESRQVFCLGIAQGPIEEHKHIWEHGLPIRADVLQIDPMNPILFNGAFECPCGKTAWLKDGVKVRDIKGGDTVIRFPNKDHMTRLQELKAKLDEGGEEALTEEDKAELQALATALIEALQPLVAAFQTMVEAALIVLADFIDHIDKEELERISRLVDAYGEKPEAEPVDVQVVGYRPLTARELSYTAMAEDSLAPILAPDPTDHVEVARRAIREPFAEPFKLTVDGISGPPVPRSELVDFIESVRPPLPPGRHTINRDSAILREAQEAEIARALDNMNRDRRRGTV